MVYYDGTGRRIRRPLRRRTPLIKCKSADVEYIRQVATDNPRLTADEVHALIRYGRRRHDISKATVRAALAGW